MKFKFYRTESRIYDFLEFPSLIFERSRIEKSIDKEDSDEAFYTSYLDFLSKVEAKLKPYTKEIELFYSLGDHDFIGLISKVNRFIGYHSEKMYLDFLLGLNEIEINTNIAYSIISGNENTQEYSEEIMRKAEALSANKSELIRLIKDLPIEAGAKWTLFLIIEEPVKYMSTYVGLMYQLLPIFSDFYEVFEIEVDSYGQYLVEFLNRNGAKGLEELTCSILDSKVMDNAETRLLISAMMPFSISISGIGDNNYMAWGLRIEDVFKRMKEENENKTNERVQVFKNLGDKTRYEVIKLIASGQSSTKEIAKILGVSSATISYHINNLLQTKIIKIDRADNKYGYIVDYKLLDVIINGLKEDLKCMN